jgi:hypothetical protein
MYILLAALICFTPLCEAQLTMFLGNAIRQNIKNENANCVVCFLNLRDRIMADVFEGIAGNIDKTGISFSVQSDFVLHDKCSMVFLKFGGIDQVSLKSTNAWCT